MNLWSNIHYILQADCDNHLSREEKKYIADLLMVQSAHFNTFVIVALKFMLDCTVRFHW